MTFETIKCNGNVDVHHKKVLMALRSEHISFGTHRFALL